MKRYILELVVTMSVMLASAVTLAGDGSSVPAAPQGTVAAAMPTSTSSAPTAPTALSEPSEPGEPGEPGTAEAHPSGLIRVQTVEVIQSPGGPVVVLNTAVRSIPMFVDSMVALSIQAALTGQGPPRPLSHDLMQSVLEGLDAKPTQVVVTLRDGTYHAALTIVAGDRRLLFDSRASDAVALAIRFRAPILLDPGVIDAAGVDYEDRRRPAI